MIAGEMHNPEDPVLLKDRKEARGKVRVYNQTLETEAEKRMKLLKELLRSTGENIYMEPNIRFDYGYNTHVGKQPATIRLITFPTYSISCLPSLLLPSTLT